MVAMMVALCGHQNLVLAQSTSSIVITAQPQNYVGKAGEINYFEIAATGTGLTYQWEMSKNGGSTWGEDDIKLLRLQHKQGRSNNEIREKRLEVQMRCNRQERKPGSK